MLFEKKINKLIMYVFRVITLNALKTPNYCVVTFYKEIIMFYRLLANIELAKMKFKDDQRGVTAVEYAIIAVAMSALVLAVYTNGDVKDAMEGAMATVKGNIEAATGAATGGAGGAGG